MGSGARLRSANQAFGRSRTGAFLLSAEPAEGGNILLLDVGGETLVFRPENVSWGVLAAGGPPIWYVSWVAGTLYGWQSNQLYTYDNVGDSWVAFGDAFGPGENIREVVDYQGDPVAAVGFDVWRWTGTAWESVATYLLDLAVHPAIAGEQTIDCDDAVISPPAEKCISGQDDPAGLGDGLESILVKNGTLYLAGFYWFDYTVPDFPALNCNPIITQNNEPIAIFEQRILRMEDGPDDLIFVQLAVEAGDKVRWRDTWPACCARTITNPPQYQQIEAATECAWVAVTAAATFDATNVIDYFGAMPSPIPTILDLRLANNQPYASLQYSPEQVIITTDEDHGINVGDFIEINASERYEQALAEYEIVEVPLPNQMVINWQFRGTERCGWNRTQPSSPSASGVILSLAPRLATPISGLYRWDDVTDTWSPAFTDNVHPEGIPGAYPMLDEDGPTYIRSEDLQDRYAFDYAVDSGLYFMSRSIPTGDGDSFERLNLTTGLSRRLCFPEVSFPNPSAPFRRVQALPAGVLVGQTPNQCTGDSVTNKFSIPNVDTIVLQCTAPHGLDGAGRIRIQNSAPVNYDGFEDIMEIPSPTEIRVRETFAGTSAGEFYWEEDPNNIQFFSAVTDGGLFTYWFVQIELGSDVRPADIVLEGAESGNVADFSGVPYDDRERVLVASTPAGQRGRRRVRNDRFGSVATSHYYLLDIPQTPDPGWVNGEQIIIRKP